MGILMRYYVWGGICDVVVSIKSYFLRHRTHLIPLSWIHPNFICFFVPLLRRDDKCERIKNFRWFFATTTLINFSFFSKMLWLLWLGTVEVKGKACCDWWLYLKGPVTKDVQTFRDLLFWTGTICTVWTRGEIQIFLWNPFQIPRPLSSDIIYGHHSQ